MNRKVANAFKVIVDLYNGDNGSEISCNRLLEGKKCQTALFKSHLCHINFMIDNSYLTGTLFILMFDGMKGIIQVSDNFVGDLDKNLGEFFDKLMNRA
jgi:aminopeptidase-like protein